MKRSFSKAGLILTAAIITLSGCSTPAPPAPPMQTPTLYPADRMQPAQRVSVPTEGSLWSETAPMGDLYTPPRAKNVGDILTVRIVESSTAVNQASTATDRESNITAGLTNFFNLEKYYPNNYVPNTWPYLNPFGNVTADLENEFDATGTTRRSGNLAATITVRVVETLPNGQLKIMGSREVMVNNERQYITLTGLVRQNDILFDNTIPSTYISDARITYSGVGVLNDKQRPGWGMRVLDVLWPF